ncbi:phage tail protein [Deinococcus soli (ex Cha et al. 2016)]|uniref:phage tail protein n=1 Tax=Deinococcus soli (ex Cha et al. 2016) TaxID=1309411 RepID=UPI0016655C82|nr:tail fiber protein [Deinococcus soli (ex Cha et al. 2016)]GGB48614.1 tail Collar domain-containing protein [Deinococcus soli (ex Cha et al. 2016)]
MADPFLAEIRLTSFNFAPRGWALCNGQLLPINQNQALFSLLGTTYGGNGQTNFALPNLQGRMPIHAGNGYTQGQAGGEVNHTLTLTELPQHTHTVQASSQAGTTPVPTGAVLAAPSHGGNLYSSGAVSAALVGSTVGGAGGSQPHINMQPSLVLNYIIALVGIYPSRP